MRLKMIYTVVVGLLLVSLSASAATQSIPLAAAQTTVEAVGTGDASLTFQIDLGKLELFDVSTKSGDFSRLVIPGFHSSKIEGSPELPMINRLISVPRGARARVEILSADSRMIDLGDYGVTKPLMPAQPSLPKNVDAADWPFAYDRGVYAQAKVASPEQVTVSAQGRLRAMDLARVEISPVEYYPSTNEVRVTESLSFRIVFEGLDAKVGSDRLAATYSPFFEHLYAGIEGSKAFHDDYPDHVTDKVTMVIVTPPMFEAQLANFVQWKTERGFKVILAVTGTPAVGTTTSSIQSYLHGLYDDATVDDPAPSFVLFVGDVNEIPTFNESGDATDRPYCAVDGDIVPDMFYGRFSATNSSQLQAILDKTMIYDQYTMSDPSYLSEVVLVAGVDATFASTHGNGQITYGTENYFNADHGITDHTWLYPASNGTGVSAEVVQAVSDGAAYVNYTAHGSQTSWSSPSFTQSNINSLGNSGQYAMVVGNCCLTGTYDYAECFGETWLRAVDKGAIGYIGASNNTLWDEDFWWGVGACASGSISANPTYAGTSLGAYDGVFHDHGEAEDTWYVTNDALVFAGNLAVLEAGSGNSTYYWNIYNLSGDPSLSTYMGVPVANVVSHLAEVPSSATGVDISADAGSYVGLTQDGVLVGSGTVGASGTVSIDLDAPLTLGVALHVVVTAQNRQPYFADLPVENPLVISIAPMAIDANVETAVTVTVMESDGTTPVVGLDVWAAGVDYSSAVVATNASGIAVISVDYPYGPSVIVFGMEPGETRPLFSEELAVNALPVSGLDLTVSNELGVADMFYQNLPGTITATGGAGGEDLLALMPSGSMEQAAGATLAVTPTVGGELVAYIARSGYDLYSETFPVSTAGSIRGVADLFMVGDDSDIVVTATPSDATSTTGSDGRYQLLDLSPGSYEVTATYTGYSAEPVTVVVAAGGHYENVNLLMAQVYEFETCAQPAIAIPDNTPAGISHSLNCDLDEDVTSVEVYVDITHTYIGDLTVSLTSPGGTEILLHDRSGGTTEDIIGWYPDDITPAATFEAWNGQNMQGNWTLKIIDNANVDTGTLDEWCLKLGYEEDLSDTNSVPEVVTLHGNCPNPFNPQTEISFYLPDEAMVDLTVFDLRGRQIITLIHETVIAGPGSITWYGKDSAGRAVGSGVYFYRLSTDGIARTKKMTLVR